MEREIIITQKNVDADSYNNQYINYTDCPLMRAIKEQAPDLGIKAVYGHGILVTKGKKREYMYIPNLLCPLPNGHSWDVTTAEALAKGKLESFTVKIVEYDTSLDWA